jgi:hypothetical protein
VRQRGKRREVERVTGVRQRGKPEGANGVRQRGHRREAEGQAA